tara:strand:+ start:24601 stop:25305 length:705 start_codon:yes stop_codon:yes gene_type:complete
VVSLLFPLILRDICVRRRGKSVLGPINITVENGGPLVVIGPNGSGKTTLLRVMHGIERINDGTIEWAAHDPAKHSYVFQQPTVLRRSVAQNLAYPLQLMGVSANDISQACAEWLVKINMVGFGNTPATRLSGGERQKLAIARALIRQPDLLFLDEPTANLDGHTTREIEDLLQHASATGTRIVMATHDMGQARRLAAHVIFMKGGKIHEQGSAVALTNPQTTDLASFLKGDIVT